MSTFTFAANIYITIRTNILYTVKQLGKCNRILDPELIYHHLWNLQVLVMIQTVTILLKNSDSNVSMSLDTNGAQTSIDSNFTENMNNYFGIAIGSKKKHESKIPTNQLEYEESLRMNIIDLYRESSLVEKNGGDGFTLVINGGDGFTLVPF